MRIPNPRLSRLSGLTRGAIMEPGDGELVVPSVLQPLVKLPSPIPRVFGAGLTMNDSFITDFLNTVGGAQAGATNIMATLTKGLWSFNWFLDAMFLGTTSVVQLSQLNLVDQLGGPVRVKQVAHFNGRQIADNGEFTILLQEDGWHFDHVLGATVVGDSLAMSVMIMGSRLL